MPLEQKIEEKVEGVLQASSVTKAKQLLRSRYGTAILAGISFIESALPVPILTDPFLAAAILINRSKASSLVVITTISSVIGGITAFAMAAFFFDLIQGWMTPALAEEFNVLVNSNGSSAFVLTLVGAVTPVPYTLVAWVVSVIKGSLGAFIIASVLGRGFRYAVVGYATYRFGPQAVSYAKRYLGVTSVIVIILAALYIWLKM